MGSDATAPDPSPGEEPTGSSIPWRSPTLAVIVANSLMAAAGAALVSPALPAIRDGLSLTEPQAGLILAVFSLPSIVLAPIAGVLADRYGRRVVLVPSLVGFGLAGGAIVFVGEFWLVIALRFLQGSAASGLITLSLTLVGDCFEGTQRNAVMGVNTAAMTLGVGAYPVLGGFLADIRWYLPFGVYGVSVLVGAFAYLALEEPEIEHRSFDLEYLRGAARHVLTREGVTLYAVVFALFLLYFGSVVTAVPFLLSEQFTLRGVQIGLILSVPLVTSSVVALGNGRLSRSYTSYQLIALGFVCYGLGLAAVWVTGAPIEVAAALLVLGVGHGFVIPSMDTAISALASDRLRGGVVSLRISAKKVGQTAGPFLFTTVGTLAGYPLLLAAVGGATLLAGAFAYWYLDGRAAGRVAPAG